MTVQKLYVVDNEAVVIEPLADGQIIVYRFELEQFKFIDGMLVSMGFNLTWPYPINHYDEWFHSGTDFHKLAKFAGLSIPELEQAFCSPDILIRAKAYEIIGEYYGYINLDGYPDKFTIKQFKEWAKSYELQEIDFDSWIAR